MSLTHDDYEINSSFSAWMTTPKFEPGYRPFSPFRRPAAVRHLWSVQMEVVLIVDKCRTDGNGYFIVGAHRTVHVV